MVAVELVEEEEERKKGQEEGEKDQRRYVKKMRKIEWRVQKVPKKSIWLPD